MKRVAASNRADLSVAEESDRGFPFGGFENLTGIVARRTEEFFPSAEAGEHERCKWPSAWDPTGRDRPSQILLRHGAVAELILEGLADPRDGPDDDCARVRICANDIADQKVSRLKIVDVFGPCNSCKEVASRIRFLRIAERLKRRFQSVVSWLSAQGIEDIVFRTGDGERLANRPASLAHNRQYRRRSANGHDEAIDGMAIDKYRHLVFLAAACESTHAGNAGEAGIPALQPFVGLDFVGVDEGHEGIWLRFKRGCAFGERHGILRITVEGENGKACAGLDSALRKYPSPGRAANNIGDVAIHSKDFAKLAEVRDVIR